jgi:hypothetical protein
MRFLDDAVGVPGSLRDGVKASLEGFSISSVSSPPRPIPPCSE